MNFSFGNFDTASEKLGTYCQILNEDVNGNNQLNCLNGIQMPGEGHYSFNAVP